VDGHREQRFGRGSTSTTIISKPLAVRTSPVEVWVSLATAAMSPAATSLTVSCSLPRIEKSWCMRSSLFERQFVSTSSCLTVPCSTLNRFT